MAKITSREHLPALVAGLALLLLLSGLSGGKNTGQLRAEAESCLSLVKDAQSVCLNNFLVGITEAHGVRRALDIIEPLSQENSHLLEWSHPFTHTIGTAGLRYYRDKGLPLEYQIGRALVDCDGFGAFGCYHGVIEVGLSLLPTEKRTEIMRKACLEDPLIQEKQYFVNQCLHWFGHGAAVFSNISLKEALGLCDGLNENFESDEVQLCLSGIFHAGPVPGESDDSLLHNVANVWKKGDPYFPCLDIEEKFRGHCYSHAAGRTLSNDLEVNFRTCDNVPERNTDKKFDYVRRCYDSAANTLLAQALGMEADDEKKVQTIVENCRKYSSAAYRRFCYAGAARYWVLRDPLLSNEAPFKICRLAERESKASCYANIGFGNNENYYSEEKLREYCSMSEPGFFEACMSKNVL